MGTDGPLLISGLTLLRQSTAGYDQRLWVRIESTHNDTLSEEIEVLYR